MEKLDGVSTVRIMKNALSMIHPSIMEHGSWVGFALYHTLKCTGKYTKEQLDNFYLIGLFHDCGAYKTDDFESLLEFDCKKVWSHSVYGYFYLKYLSPLSEYADILLYHHLDYRCIEEIQYDFKEISMYLAVIDRIDVMLRQNSFVFRQKYLEPYRDKKLWGEAIDLFLEAENRYGLIIRNKNRDYQDEAYNIVREMNLSTETCRDMLKALVYMMDFRNENTALRTIHANIISVGICKLLQLGPEAEDKMYYASMLYDIGMLSVSQDILNAPRKLTLLETRRVQLHVTAMEKILSGNVSDEVIAIAARHHERLDGSGYPRGLKGDEIDRLSRILEVTDVMVALNTEHSYREPFNRDEIVRILSGEGKNGKLCPEVVDIVIANYDSIFDKTEEIKQKILSNYWRIKDEFEVIMKRFDKYNR